MSPVTVCYWAMRRNFDERIDISSLFAENENITASACASGDALQTRHIAHSEDIDVFFIRIAVVS